MMNNGQVKLSSFYLGLSLERESVVLNWRNKILAILRVLIIFWFKRWRSRLEEDEDHRSNPRIFYSWDEILNTSKYMKISYLKLIVILNSEQVSLLFLVSRYDQVFPRKFNPAQSNFRHNFPLLGKKKKMKQKDVSHLFFALTTRTEMRLQ